MFFNLAVLTALSFLMCNESCAYASDSRFAQLSCGQTEDIPKKIHLVGRNNHIQGFAVDTEKKCIYASFTTAFYKTDYQGNIIASIENIPGHLGAMSRNPGNGKVYASLEIKDDEIGRRIAAGMGIEAVTEGQSAFYIAILDVDRMDRMGMDPEKDSIMELVRIEDACRDYAEGHRYGCSGIDGVAFAPGIGSDDGKMYLYVAYGIYGDTGRNDNDDQVLLCYDPDEFDGAEPLHKYFVRTGNTTYGVQNMAYDKWSGRLYMFVYKGKKAEFPNYLMFSLDFSQKPDNDRLRLAEDGLKDEATGIRGWNFKWGSTGFCPLGNGEYMISENGYDNLSGQQYSDLRLYRWTGRADEPFCHTK